MTRNMKKKYMAQVLTDLWTEIRPQGAFPGFSVSEPYRGAVQ